MSSATRSEGRFEGGERTEASVPEATVILVSVVAVTGGSLLPWGTGAGGTMYGFEGSGLWTLVLGLVAGAVAYWYGWTGETMMTMVVAGAFVSVLAYFSLGGAAIGVYVTLAAGVALYLAGVSGYRKV